MKLTDTQIAHVKMMEDEHGRLTAAQLVTDAKREDSPLHDLFEWDVTKAAEAHWLDIGREIIRTVTVIVTQNDVTIKVPNYVRDPDAKGQGYRSITSLRGDEDAAREALRNEFTRAAGVLQRARYLAVGLNLTDAVDQLLAQVAGLQTLLVPVEAEAETVAVEH